MQQVELKGHSGCRIYLIIPEGSSALVRKISKEIGYNERLRKQCFKQKTYRSNYAHVPEVLEEGMINDLYYYDMEYVRGISVSSMLESCSVDKIESISNFLVNIVNENQKTETFDENGWTSAIAHKLKSTFDNIPKRCCNKTIKESFELLSNHKWTDIGTSSSHGDLTLENIIYSYDEKFYLIDFLDTFYETWIIDMSKILQDLVVGWAFRHQFMKTDAISENTKIRILLLNKQFISSIEDVLVNEKLWDDIYACLLLNLLRIIPYIQDDRIHVFLNKSINTIMSNIERGGLYEFINTALRWPIYEVPGSQTKMDVNVPRRQIDASKGP